MALGLHSLVTLLGFYHYPADTGPFKQHYHFPRMCFGSTQCLWIVRDLTFKVKPRPPSLTQLKFVVRLALSKIIHGYYQLLASSPRTNEQEKA